MASLHIFLLFHQSHIYSSIIIYLACKNHSAMLKKVHFEELTLIFLKILKGVIPTYTYYYHIQVFHLLLQLFSYILSTMQAKVAWRIYSIYFEVSVWLVFKIKFMRVEGMMHNEIKNAE